MVSVLTFDVMQAAYRNMRRTIPGPVLNFVKGPANCDVPPLLTVKMVNFIQILVCAAAHITNHGSRLIGIHHIWKYFSTTYQI
jgi:hypothetical protein